MVDGSENKVQQRIESHIKQQKPVIIDFNDELGTECYAVCDAEEKDFWLDSFESESDAMTFCSANGLVVASKSDSRKRAAQVDVPLMDEPANPENKLTDEEVMSELQRLMDIPGMSTLCGMLVNTFQIHTLIRMELARVCPKDTTPEVISALIQGLGTTAAEPFSLQELKKNVKHVLVPFIYDQVKIAASKASKNKKGK